MCVRVCVLYKICTYICMCMCVNLKLFMLAISRSLWPCRCSSDCIVWHKKEEMCLVPGVLWQLIVSSRRGSGRATALGSRQSYFCFWLLAGVQPRSIPSLPPQPGHSLGHRWSWGTRGDLGKRRGCSTTMQMCEMEVLQKDREIISNRRLHKSSIKVCSLWPLTIKL